MSTEIVTTENVTHEIVTTEIVTIEDGITETNLEDVFLQSSTWLSESEVTSSETTLGEFPTTETVNNASVIDKQHFPGNSEVPLSVFEAFIIIEIVMTALELIISILAASKVARWRRNYRNQMLMQLSIVRFLKRVFSLAEFLNSNKVAPYSVVTYLLISVQIYIDFVIVVLVCFFIRHMYNTLILVLVKTNKNQLVKVLMCAWLLPAPISVLGSLVVVTGLFSYWSVYLLICSAVKWPLMLIGTLIYITILIKVLRDKIRKFARSLTIITFLLCLVINVTLFSKDVVWLWCIHSGLAHISISLLGFIMNVLILCLYIVLIVLHLKCKTKSRDSLPNYSECITKC